jgi:hypothetical protein
MTLVCAGLNLALQHLETQANAILPEAEAQDDAVPDRFGIVSAFPDAVTIDGLVSPYAAPQPPTHAGLSTFPA